MSRNSSSSNDSLRPSHHSFANSSGRVAPDCYIYEPASFIYASYNITYILLLLPLCIFILHHGLQQWRQKKRSASSAVTVSHCDCFTYHMVAVELICVFACVLLLCSIYRKDLTLLLGAIMLSLFTSYGLGFFHLLTCVERYLAVVHPITYLSLRNQRGIRIRNISITCGWLLSFVMMCLVMIEIVFTLVSICILFLSLILISFCSISVLRVLIRPGPGEQGGGRERVDQSKLRAFYTITSILGVLLLRFVGDLVSVVLTLSGKSHACVFVVSAMWLHLPSTLVVPLLFLHRAGKLVCWKNNN